jgi:hypothetical protein
MNADDYLKQPYIRKLKQARTFGLIPPKPGVVVIEVLHEDGCPLLSGQGPCRCNPDVGLPNRRERRAERAKGGRR